MDNLLTISDRDFNPSSARLPEDQYTLREAARAILFDPNDAVYLMHVTKHSYHKLPGGGIDAGESPEAALARELMEEVGCQAEILRPVGQITEYRSLLYGIQKQISYCFIAKQIGEQAEASLEEGEIAEGMIQMKAKNIDEAIRLLEKDTPDNLEGQFIQKRDLKFLEAAKTLLKP